VNWLKMKNLSRRGFFGGAAGAALAGGFADASAPVDVSAANSLKRRPNLIFFMPDELRADALSCYRNPICRTPTLDRLANEGTRFAQCHVAYPVCGASFLFDESGDGAPLRTTGMSRLLCTFWNEKRPKGLSVSFFP
jgi:hypothetical protein